MIDSNGSRYVFVKKQANKSQPTLNQTGPVIPLLVAHRGDRGRFPENTRSAIEAALKCGACYVEFDVQLTKDGVPVVCHDIDLQRVTGQAGNLLEMDYAELTVYSAHEPQRFGARFSYEPITDLANMVHLLQHWPQVTAFVEIKRASLRHFGIETVLSRLREVLQPVQQHCVLISFDDAVLQSARDYGFSRIGWVFDEWQDDNIVLAEQLQPDFLFTDVNCVPADVEGLWMGPWQWVVYEVSDPTVALQWANRGADLVETDNISVMLQSPLLPQAPCGS